MKKKRHQLPTARPASSRVTSLFGDHLFSFYEKTRIALKSRLSPLQDLKRPPLPRSSESSSPALSWISEIPIIQFLG